MTSTQAPVDFLSRFLRIVVLSFSFRPVLFWSGRGLAVIGDPRVVEKILCHLGAWHDPPDRPRPQGVRGPYTYEPCDGVDPTPDYENVLTD